jgi:hypothetical protein
MTRHAPGRRSDIWQDHIWGLVRNCIFNDLHDEANAVVAKWAELYVLIEDAKESLSEAVGEHHENKKLIRNAVWSVTKGTNE